MEDGKEGWEFIKLKIKEINKIIGKIPILIIGLYINENHESVSEINKEKLKELNEDLDFIYMVTASGIISDFKEGLYMLIRKMIEKLH